MHFCRHWYMFKLASRKIPKVTNIKTRRNVFFNGNTFVFTRRRVLVEITSTVRRAGLA